MIKFKAVIKTSGKGLWSDAVKDVKLLGMDIPYTDDNDSFGELRVYFDTNTWNTFDDGLIYTDEKFLNELRIFLCVLGFPGSDVNYSEQGMQGRDFISLDVGVSFIKTFIQASVAMMA
jgi:hypothetical protein